MSPRRSLLLRPTERRALSPPRRRGGPGSGRLLQRPADEQSCGAGRPCWCSSRRKRDRASCRSSGGGRWLYRAHNSWITGRPRPRGRRDDCNRGIAVTPSREAARSHSRGRRRGDGGCGTGPLARYRLAPRRREITFGRLSDSTAFRLRDPNAIASAGCGVIACVGIAIAWQPTTARPLGRHLGRAVCEVAPSNAIVRGGVHGRRGTVAAQ